MSASKNRWTIFFDYVKVHGVWKALGACFLLWIILYKFFIFLWRRGLAPCVLVVIIFNPCTFGNWKDWLLSNCNAVTHIEWTTGVLACSHGDVSLTACDSNGRQESLRQKANRRAAPFYLTLVLVVISCANRRNSCQYKDFHFTRNCKDEKGYYRLTLMKTTKIDY